MKWYELAILLVNSQSLVCLELHISGGGLHGVQRKGLQIDFLIQTDLDYFFVQDDPSESTNLLLAKNNDKEQQHQLAAAKRLLERKDELYKFKTPWKFR